MTFVVWRIWQIIESSGEDEKRDTYFGKYSESPKIHDAQESLSTLYSGLKI